MGEEIGHYGVPEELSPLTFVFTSQGNVSKVFFFFYYYYILISQGAQEIFELLPHKMVTPQEMVQIVKNKDSKLS